MDVNKQAYENTIKIDIDLYDHGVHLYRKRNNKNFSKYLKDKKEIKTILNKKLPKEINILQYNKDFNI